MARAVPSCLLLLPCALRSSGRAARAGHPRCEASGSMPLFRTDGAGTERGSATRGSTTSRRRRFVAVGEGPSLRRWAARGRRTSADPDPRRSWSLGWRAGGEGSRREVSIRYLRPGDHPREADPPERDGICNRSLRAGLWICSMDRGRLPGSPPVGPVEKRVLTALHPRWRERPEREWEQMELRVRSSPSTS
jgi:hypothetical protein